ncbi:MAG: T9SS type A sorting domain-containing protein [Bacteroidetes bacterium]|nr:T9SS type A sorting domain-containing protein [Bacteroidota bacterium]
MAVDSLSNAYIGVSIGNENYQTGVVTHLKKLDSNGNLIWDKFIGRGCEIQSIAVDNSNRVLLGIEYFDYVQIDNYIFQKTPPSRNILVVKLNEYGTAIWAKEEGMTSINEIKEIKADKQNNIYLTGRTTHEGVFNGVQLGGNMGGFAFLLQYNSDGVFQWIRIASERSNGYSLVIDRKGDCYMAGTIRGKNTFGDGKNSFTVISPKIEIINGNVIEPNNIFIAKYSPEGDIKWAIATEGNEFGDNFPLKMCIDYLDRIFIHGFIRSGYNGATNITKFGNYSISSSYYKVYIARLIDDGTLGVEEIKEGKALKIYPNPTKNYLNIEYNQTKATDKVHLRIMGLNGSLIYNEIISGFAGKFSKNIDLSGISRGVYFVEILAGEERIVKKVVVN